MEYEKLLSDLEEIGEEIRKSKVSFDSLYEIYINSGKRTALYTENGKIKIGNPIPQNKIRDIFAALCEYSVHTYKDEICEGYITSKGGFRIGICGTALYQNEKIIGIKDISALNIRIPHEVIGSAEKIAELYKNCGILIVGPPCCGKTTVLRDFSRIVSMDKKTVIIDERSEIAALNHGIPFFDIGEASIMNEFKKSDGMIRAVRSMGPEIIVCDEFGGTKDIESAFYAMKSGAFIVASAHAFDEDDFITKPFSKEIIKSGIFKFFVFLGKDKKIKTIKTSKELIS